MIPSRPFSTLLDNILMVLLFLSTIIKWHNYLFKNQTDNGVAVSGLSKGKENWFRINRANSKKISIVFKITMFDSGMDP